MNIETITKQGITSKSLHDFIYESNHGNNVFFQTTKEDAINKLYSQQ